MSDTGRLYTQREIADALAALPAAWDEQLLARVRAEHAARVAAAANREFASVAAKSEGLRNRARAATASYETTLQSAQRTGLANGLVMRRRLEDLRERSEQLERECRAADAELMPYRLKVAEADELAAECGRLVKECQARVKALKWVASQPIREREREAARRRREARNENRQLASRQPNASSGTANVRSTQAGADPDTHRSDWVSDMERAIRRSRPWV